MKKALLTLFLSLNLAGLLAQKNYEISPDLDEFEGWTKLIQLRNNNTALLEVTKKEGISVTLFDASRKKISSKKLNLTKVPEKLAFSTIEGSFDINGDLVFFVFVVDKNDDGKNYPTLFRVIVSGTSGELKSEEKIAELNEYKFSQGYAIAFGDVDPPTIYVEKDPESDYYAIIRYNSFAEQTGERIEVLHYDPEHKVINSAKYTTPTDKFKFTKYLSAYVNKDEYVVIGTYAFNTKKSGGEEAQYYVSQLRKGKSTFIQKELEFTEFCKKATCNFIYNKPKGIINMILVPEVNFFGGSYIFQNINPTTMKLEKPYNLDMTKLNEYYKEEMDRKKDFSGGIYSTQVDNDGNLIILFHRCRFKYQNPGPGVPPIVVNTTLLDIALLTVSPEGETIKSSLLPYGVIRCGDKRSFTYNDGDKGKKGPFQFLGNGPPDWYFNINLISTETNNYLFLNNLKVNVEKAPDEKVKIISGIAGTNGMKYVLESGILNGSYLFGTPLGKKDSKFGNFAASDYNYLTKTFSTIVTDPKEKKSNVIWMKLN